MRFAAHPVFRDESLVHAIVGVPTERGVCYRVAAADLRG